MRHHHISHPQDLNASLVQAALANKWVVIVGDSTMRMIYHLLALGLKSSGANGQFRWPLAWGSHGPPRADGAKHSSGCRAKMPQRSQKLRLWPATPPLPPPPPPIWPPPLPSSRVATVHGSRPLLTPAEHEAARRAERRSKMTPMAEPEPCVEEIFAAGTRLTFAWCALYDEPQQLAPLVALTDSSVGPPDLVLAGGARLPTPPAPSSLLCLHLARLPFPRPLLNHTVLVSWTPVGAWFAYNTPAIGLEVAKRRYATAIARLMNDVDAMCQSRYEESYSREFVDRHATAKVWLSMPNCGMLLPPLPAESSTNASSASVEPRFAQTVGKYINLLNRHAAHAHARDRRRGDWLWQDREAPTLLPCNATDDCANGVFHPTGAVLNVLILRMLRLIKL